MARAKAQYNKKYREARVTEDARYAATGGKDPATGKNLSRRPDTLARKLMDAAQKSINRQPTAGHVPGIAISDRFYLRAEMGVLGMHYPPLGGIDYIAKPSVPGCPKYATSIVAAGGYEDDRDDGHELVYTGQGGNDLLGNRKQQGEQKLVLGNLALVGNIQLGVPVRVTRRNEEKDALSGYVFIYDGLYDVVKYWLANGVGGHAVYKYLLRRRPNQGELATCRVEFGGRSAPKGMSALTRHGVFDLDLSCGKEPKPIVAVNEVNEAIVPFSERGNILREPDMKGNPLTHLISDSAREAHQKSLEYISTSIMAEGLTAPPPALLPAKFKGRPHAYVQYLNGGLFPYHDLGSKGSIRQARRVQPVLYECGPHFGCAEGHNCSQAATLMGCPYRLEVFQTPNKGWGLRSWDLIPTGAFVIMYTGRYIRATHPPLACPGTGAGEEDSSDDKAQDERHDDEYNFDILPRPYADCENVKLPLLQPESSWEVKCVLDAKHEGNAARFINHSCDPNLYVQPVLSSHHDHTLHQVCLFASQTIAPLSELTFDYGMEYIQTNLDGRCHCGTAACVGKLSAVNTRC
ncbi:hypothetical protein ABBQ38_012226 [Trebouxia sp. C0009 RCD-2024]